MGEPGGLLSMRSQSWTRLKRLSSSSSSGIFKKTGDMKGIFHARMGMIKGGNSKGLTEVENIKKR